jgi:long-chain acyl-CoA synthetase
VAIKDSVKIIDTIPEHLAVRARETPDRLWLKDRHGDDFTTWTWAQAHNEVNAAAAWLETHYGKSQSVFGILSRNRAHWMLADMAITASGNVSAPLFTTLLPDTAEYILSFTEASALIVGEAGNWESVKAVLPDGIDIIALPGVDPGMPHTRWEDIIAQGAGELPSHQCNADDLQTLVFTSGTTGVPKGVMQTHASMLIPMQRCIDEVQISEYPRFLSYLPLAHVAERQLIWIQSLIYGGEVTFNEDLTTLLRDMADTKPHYLFGVPRVWEQLQQGVLAKFGGQAAFDEALQNDHETVQRNVTEALGLQHAEYLLTAAAPTPSALMDWYQNIGITLMEGYGQSEAMGLIANSHKARKIGSIGVALDGVEARISEEGELCVRSRGLAAGYYKNPEKTAETFVDGWVHTGDKATVDEDGFYYLTGRVKDQFKTMHGKFVSPPPMESAFSECEAVEQLSLLGRGYSKTVMVVVLTALAQSLDKADVEAQVLESAMAVNDSVEHHAQIGAIIITTDPWTIENGVLTPTMKIKRDKVEATHGELAEGLARKAAEQKQILLHWV